ncbi:uncharacterized protein LOC119652196 [Hermetia illucens]|uniref:uncharacterized protein LOC119652196 n=1 Tax=Hermetia illucens TaxID=343691 RepID=UPI0018CC0415|nr:uncharacterized protein LOC119652196 [Hermetia illucens]
MSGPSAHFYQFNPFSPSKHTLNTDEGIIDMDIWGRMETSYLNDSTSLTHWAQNYPFTYNGYPMTSVMFPRLPTVVKWTELPKPFAESYFCDARPYSKDYGGFDAITFGNLLQILNFTPYTFRPVNEYGYQLDNGTYIGSIGDVLYSKAGFSSNGRFVQDYGTSEIEFMYPTFFDKFCIIAPKAQQIPQWLAVFRCFNPYVWTLFLVSTTILGFIWYLFKKWTCYLHKNRLITKKTDELISPLHDTIPVAIIDMWLIMTSGVPSILPYHSVERLFMTGCLLLSLTIGGTFQGSLTTSYSTKSYYADIHTLKQLDESGLPIGTSSRNLANILDSDNNPVLNSLQKKFIISSVPVIDQTAFKRDICCIERASDITVIMTTTFELADGSALLHVIEECPRSYHLAFIVRKGWPFLTRFNEIVMRFSEAGFLFLWYEQAETAIILSERIKRLKDLKDTLQAFSLEDMQTAFYILLIGLIFCTIIFFFELWLGRRKEGIRIREKTKEIGDVMCNAIKPRKVFYIN